MLQKFAGAVALLFALAEMASAQVIPGDSPTSRIYWSNIGSNISSEDRWREADSERKYREAVRKIPDRKPSSNDPWKSIRPASTTAADRHRVE